LFESLGGRDQFQTVNVQLVRSDKTDPPDNDEAFAFLRITVMDPDAKKAGKFFSSRVVEIALASIPGFTLTAPPGNGSPAVIHWPALVSTRQIYQKLHIGDRTTEVPPVPGPHDPVKVAPLEAGIPAVPYGPTVQVPLGRAFATRAGDKGGNANLGIWAQTPEAFAFLDHFMTTDKLKELLPDCAPYNIDRFRLPNLLAVNFYIRGVLGDGVAASVRSDPQAK
ncbi:MAG: exopolyphosphatase, partial [Desulfobacterales bacterium]|nr:exopolyphosphatase [Desulfobacterales bacterium]